MPIAKGVSRRAIASFCSLRSCTKGRPEPSRYYSTKRDNPAIFPPTQSAILSAALCHVPIQGFTLNALSQGARDAGYLDASLNLFPRGAFELVNYYLLSRRLAMKDGIAALDGTHGVDARVRAMVLLRLRSNKEIIHCWQEALALMTLRRNIASSLTELALLSDEFFFLAGDTTVDFSWYTKRVALSTVYSSAELFMTTDRSPDFIETECFLDRRLEDLKGVGGAIGAFQEWAAFSGQASLNLARSKGLRI